MLSNYELGVFRFRVESDYVILHNYNPLISSNKMGDNVVYESTF